MFGDIELNMSKKNPLKRGFLILLMYFF